MTDVGSAERRHQSRPAAAPAAGLGRGGYIAGGTGGRPSGQTAAAGCGRRVSRRGDGQRETGDDGSDGLSW